MPGYKLIYFDTHGRGELIRLLFAVAGVEFEDIRLTDEEPATEWNALKPSLYSLLHNLIIALNT